MKYDEISIEVSESKSDEIEQFLLENEQSFEVADATTLQPPPKGRVRFRMYLQETERVSFVNALKEEGIGSFAQIDIRSREESEWRDVWKQFFRAREVGRFVIVPSWEEQEFRPALGQVVIRLDPGRAFGTGGHASTRLCLGLIDERVISASTVLDVGCGCGTLAIAVLLANPRAQAVAIDIDLEAVEVTIENAGRNGLLGRMAISDTRVDVLLEQYPVVFANLTGPTLLELAPSLVSCVETGGCLIVSGILKTEADEVMKEFTNRGLFIEQSAEEEEWAAYRLRKSV